jgi:16S rRNA G527 N7-methylase RsmG
MDETRLIEDINLQIENLERLNKEINELLAQLKESPDFIQIRACASILQDFYSGIEKIKGSKNFWMT